MVAHRPPTDVHLEQWLRKRFADVARVLRCQRTMEFIVLVAAIIISVLLALGSTRVVLWVLMLGIMRDAPPPAVDGILPDAGVSVIESPVPSRASS